MRKMAGLKYKNIKTDGYSSKKESKRAAELRLLERSGAITGLQEQVVYILAPSVVIQGRKRPPIKYVADFVYTERFTAPVPEFNSKTYVASARIANLEQTVVEDCKGFRTPVYKLKRHLMATVHGIQIRET